MIYFIKLKNFDFVKIGYTKNKNVNKRINSYKTHTPFEVETLLIIEGDLNLESELLIKFDKYRIKNKEWFILSEEILDYIEKYKNKHISQKITIQIKHSEIKKKKASEMYINNVPIKEIADYLGTTIIGAYRVLKKLNIKRPNYKASVKSYPKGYFKKQYQRKKEKLNNK
jgi:hypothetical protein